MKSLTKLTFNLRIVFCLPHTCLFSKFSSLSLSLNSQFPPILSDDQRVHYKRVFGEDYEEYNSLKERIETISPMCAALSDKLDSLPKHSEEAKVSGGFVLQGTCQLW